MDELALLVLQTGTRMSWEDVLAYIRRSVEIIVQLARDEGGRTIRSIKIVRTDAETARLLHQIGAAA